MSHNTFRGVTTMQLELFGFDHYAIWLDLSVWPDMTGILFDAGPQYGGYFVSILDVISLWCF